MYKKLISQKLIVSLIAGICGVGLLGSLASLSAQAQQQTKKTNPPSFSKLQNPKELNLQTNRSQFIPSELNQSPQPGPRKRAIIGRDDRIPMTSKSYPWSSVGKITGISADGSEYICTGTLIAEDVILTNAHCVIDPNNGQFAKGIYFQPNLIDGSVRNKEDIAVATQVYAGSLLKSDKDYVDDWAIVKLNKPIGKKYGYLGWKALPLDTLIGNSKQFALVGYSGDFPNSKNFQEFTAGPSNTAGVHIGCSILREKDGLIYHNCDTTGGASGGPIIGRVNGEWSIVGLHSGWNMVDGLKLNRAVQISRIQERLSK